MKLHFSWVFHGSTKETRACLVIFKRAEIFFPDFLQKPYADTIISWKSYIIRFDKSVLFLAIQPLENTNASNSDEVTVLKIIRPKRDSRRDILCHNITKITL